MKALARADGEPQWETTLDPSESNYIEPQLIIDGPRVYAVHERGAGEQRGETITALALSDGAVLWTLEAPAEDFRHRMRTTLLEPGRLLVSSALAHGAVEYDGASGKVVRTLPLYPQCDTPRTIIGMHNGALVVLPRAGREAELKHLTGATRVYMSGPCGERGDDVIIGTALNDDANIGLARVDGTSGALRWQLDLGTWIFGDTLQGDGRLPRFLPLVVFGRQFKDGPIVTQVVIVDLDAGSIVSRTPVNEHMLPLVTAERGYVMAPFAGVLFALDPATGALASATKVDGIHIADVRPEDFRFGRLWLTSMNWARPSDLGWAVFDLDQARPLLLHGALSAHDVTAQGWSFKR